MHMYLNLYLYLIYIYIEVYLCLNIFSPFCKVMLYEFQILCWQILILAFKTWSLNIDILVTKYWYFPENLGTRKLKPNIDTEGQYRFSIFNILFFQYPILWGELQEANVSTTAMVEKSVLSKIKKTIENIATGWRTIIFFWTVHAYIQIHPLWPEASLSKSDPRNKVATRLTASRRRLWGSWRMLPGVAL